MNVIFSQTGNLLRYLFSGSPYALRLCCAFMLVLLPFCAAQAQLLNVSTRARVQPGEGATIAGFIIAGQGSKQVMMRALGPSLSAHAVGSVLANPTLRLNESATQVAFNDNWKDTQQEAIVATKIPPPNELESAIIASLGARAFTAVLEGENQGTGVGLIEVYDIEPENRLAALVNISTRGVVGTGDNVMILGFIIGNNTGGNKTDLLLRGLGPSLVSSGVNGVLTDPTLELRNGNGELIAANNNWKDTQREQLSRGFPPSNDLESAIRTALGPGAYTAILAGSSGGTGVGLVEVYTCYYGCND